MASESPSGAKPEETRKGAPRQESEASKEERKQQARQPSSGQLARREPSWPSIFGGAFPWGASPFTMMRRMFDDLDRMFEEFSGTPVGRELRRTTALGEGPWAPQVDVVEREGKLVVRADLPGIEKDDLTVEVTQDGLVLEGERRRDVEEEKGGVYRRERSYGSFRRLIPLPEGVDPESAEARFHDGVLEVTLQLPKERARGKRIEIQGGKPAVH